MIAAQILLVVDGQTMPTGLAGILQVIDGRGLAIKTDRLEEQLIRREPATEDNQHSAKVAHRERITASGSSFQGAAV